MTALDVPVVGERTTRRRARPRRLLGLAVLLALVVAAALASIAVGTRSIGVGEVWRALFDNGLSTEEAVIVRQLRVPRTALGLLVGLALGVAGALMQGHTRNPLGDPGLLGVTAGASLAVVLAIAWFGVDTPSGYVWFAFAGAARRHGARLRDRLGRPRRRHARDPRPGRGGAVGAAVRAGPRRAGQRRSRPSTASGSGWSARSPGAAPTSPGRCCRSSRSALVLAIANAPALNLLGARRGRRPRPRAAHLAGPRRRPGGDHPALRGRDRRLRADRVRRPGRAARRCAPSPAPTTAG